MTTLQFKCTLLSDVILNQKAATEGPNQTLDFIPGSNFLGIVASKLYPKKEDEKAYQETLNLFHSDKVRFGDAHPSGSGIRGLKIPASMFYPKLKKPNDECYIHHLIPENQLNSDAFKKKQIKQCRSGFYLFDNNQANKVKTDTNFAIKSAYDKDLRRSKDEHMFGYESLQKGLELYFEVEVDDEALAETVKKALVGKDKRIGRSRSAQYGLVSIEEFDFTEQKSKAATNDKVTVYADGRLIFLDEEFGLPTFCPTAEQLGFSKKDKILWEKSQIRTFQYAPWNFTRQCFDADRCGIEKGSVFVVKTAKKEFKSQYVGSYRNEGFGKVIYNPEFLEVKDPSTGLAKYQILPYEDVEKKRPSVSLSGTPLLNYLEAQQQMEKREQEVYQKVNKWVGDHKAKFKGELFASQWGAIRSIAMTHKSLEDLKKELFEKTVTHNGKSISAAYLTHGVAADKWNERGRKKALEDFMKDLDDNNAQMAVINLAAEMAKKCKEDRQ